uniref:3-dehydroquinate dehydratase n=1 Tax=uncultured bacterium contig00009 TaxID=1181501 RepID=A0A806KPW0_9BACT|nr:hypothetical protein [uncultured bacterium contig00009]
MISPVVLGCITGLGWRSYECGLRALIGILRDRLAPDGGSDQ